MSVFIVDVEHDGPYVADYSMISFGVVRLQADLSTTPTFLGEVAPISDRYEAARLALLGISREQHLTYASPEIVMPRLVSYLTTHSQGRATFMSDNPANDWQWLNYYLHRYTGGNPFGYSARRIGDLYAGLAHEFRATSHWKRLRKTVHDHNPMHDAMGNAEALLAIGEKYGLKIL